MSYSQIAWLPLAGGVALLGFIGSWFAWRRRGAAAGLRGVAWSLLPVAAYLTGIIKVLWQVGSAIASWAASFVFSLQVWLGVAVAGVAATLFVVSGWLRGRRSRKGSGAQPAASALTSGVTSALGSAGGTPASVTAGKGKTATKPAGRKSGAQDDDLSDVQEILRRHGIR
jgi:hypothetical protein